jgi:hypothetical protein
MISEVVMANIFVMPNNIIIVYIVLVHNIILVNNVMPVPNDMLMRNNSFSFSAVKHFFVHTLIHLIKPVAVTHTHLSFFLFLSYNMAGLVYMLQAFSDKPNPKNKSQKQ